jgi:hypothetical protein
MLVEREVEVSCFAKVLCTALIPCALMALLDSRKTIAKAHYVLERRYFVIGGVVTITAPINKQ